MLNGILLVDKSGGITSHGVVARARRALDTRKIGHAGTLDPLATGLLVLGVGPSTRLLTFLVGLDKAYRATVRFGESTTTDDAEGERIALAEASAVAALDAQRVRSAFAALTGEIDQVPSTVSAIKVDGKRAYARVRAGEEVELASRRVTISDIEVGEARQASTADGALVLDVDVTVRCSSGTYIRAIARDAGIALSVGGHLTSLRRTEVGPFRVGDATSDDSLEDARLLTPESVAHELFAAVHLDPEDARSLESGRRVRIQEDAPGDLVATYDPDGRLIGIAENRDGMLVVRANFPKTGAPE